MELKEAQNFIDTHHRHHQAAHRDKFRIAAMEDGEIVRCCTSWQTGLVRP